MQLIHSEMSKNEYLWALKDSLSSPFDFFNERFVGLCIGRFYYVIHHCEHQWDRKYNSPTNAAIGYVTNSNDGSDVFFFTFKGLLCPRQLLIIFCLVLILPVVICLVDPYFLELYKSPLFWIISVASVIFFAGIHSLFESMTDRSAEGENRLLSLLYDPYNPY